MSHQSGIEVSLALSEQFAQATQSDSTTRFIQVTIADGALQANHVGEWQQNADADFGKLTSLVGSSNDPCYLLYRLDTTTSPSTAEAADTHNDTSPTYLEDRWLFISYIPDHGKVREKMIYASTQSTLLKQLGSNKFVHTMAVRDAEDIRFATLSEFARSHRIRSLLELAGGEGKGELAGEDPLDDLPLSEREKEIRRLEKEQAADLEQLTLTSSSRRAHVPGVQFNATPSAEAALEAFHQALTKSGATTDDNAVILRVDTETESLDMDPVETAAFSVRDTAELVTRIPADEPRFILYRFRATGTEATDNSQYPIFIYYCPITSPVRTRMLFSAYRGGLVNYIQKSLDYQFTKRLETDDLSELTDAYIQEEIEPVLQQQAASAAQTSGIDMDSLPPTKSNHNPAPNPLHFKRPTAPGRSRTRPARRTDSS
ncbi:Twinfilin-1 [Dimargaris cristalligena]|nr:Twinfilin-1 [Dimargaris cristalligena]